MVSMLSLPPGSDTEVRSGASGLAENWSYRSLQGHFCSIFPGMLLMYNYAGRPTQRPRNGVRVTVMASKVHHQSSKFWWLQLQAPDGGPTATILWRVRVSRSSTGCMLGVKTDQSGFKEPKNSPGWLLMVAGFKNCSSGVGNNADAQH